MQPVADPSAPLATATFILDESSLQTTFTEKPLADIFALTGGLMAIILVFFRFFMNPIQEQLFRASLVKRLFLIQAKSLSEQNIDDGVISK